MATLLLLRRRRTPTPAERVLRLTSAAMRVLPAARTARTTYRVVRRAPLVAGAGVVGVVVVRRVRASGGGSGGGAGGGTAGAAGAGGTGPAAAPPPPAPTTPVAASPGTSATDQPHGDPLTAGAPATAASATAGPEPTAMDSPQGDALTGTTPPSSGEPGPAGTTEVETGGGPSPAMPPAEDDTAGGGMVGAPDLAGEQLGDEAPLLADDVAGGGMVGAPDPDLTTGDDLATALEGEEPLPPDESMGAADLPPNESAPGHDFPPAPPEDALTGEGDAAPDAPNEGATGEFGERDRP
jgi:hypothetical protein